MELFPVGLSLAIECSAQKNLWRPKHPGVAKGGGSRGLRKYRGCSRAQQATFRNQLMDLYESRYLPHPGDPSLAEIGLRQINDPAFGKLLRERLIEMQNNYLLQFPQTFRSLHHLSVESSRGLFRLRICWWKVLPTQLCIRIQYSAVPPN